MNIVEIEIIHIKLHLLKNLNNTSDHFKMNLNSNIILEFVNNFQASFGSHSYFLCLGFVTFMPIIVFVNIGHFTFYVYF